MARSSSRTPRRKPVNPLAAPEFTTLRAVYFTLSEGGLPPYDERTPADDARIITFFALQEILRVLEEFRRACSRGEVCHLIARDRGRSPSRVTIDLRIEWEDE